MICKVLKTIGEYKMLSHGQTVVVGLSGGADSSALLHILCSLKDEYSLKIIAAHVNHCIRGDEALRDESFARGLSEELGVEFRLLREDVPALSEKLSLGLEECGRMVRYDFFSSLAGESGVIATAHNLNDRCETMIFNIARGAGIGGLASIPARRGNIIRPLIDCTRAEIEDYCARNSIDYVTDSTNNSDEYTRNSIRLNIMPRLREINPSVEKAMLRLAKSAKEDDDYLSSSAGEAVSRAECPGGYRAASLASLHPSIRARALESIITKQIGCRPESRHITAVADILNGGSTQILTGIKVTCRDGVLTFGDIKKTEKWRADFALGKKIKIPSGTIRFEINTNDHDSKQFVHKNVLDYDKLQGELVLRSFENEDEIKIASRACTKTVKNLLKQAKVRDRNSVCVLADSAGPAWVLGFGCAQRCCVDKTTKKVLRADYGKE